ncbi:MAG: DUF2808 domain-containing protein [Brasilonema octagenarum HA4186-MV1]|jgi:hypothetical protein|uniref:DUF2808 domain-containing protein n=2 Tax=Brasilonema TaxID=383614 RepID=A0A856MM00_9CYAN|nr:MULTISPECIES: DUF2808 domain-containing protein [Brasilonema]MBW4624689.1 DUF2808 domain-containing protein [Brasilonema octagenarum HA4186-MV1]NMF61650.1 hypothetical protein [Brasilonema octagenarum UFV-OR1]QDL11114.1 hypothetical protein DP114_27365 [Brasilonema sennae CENA114]QDL17460.1 hypothetical protein DP113_27295 [Brasilonema octagenarum UFV-E1]
MKKTLISAAAFALTSAALIFAGYATAKTDNNRVSNVNDVNFPPNSWRIVKHTFRVHIPENNNALSQLIIDTPSSVAVSNDIDVLDNSGQKININISVNGRRILIDFPEKVISNTKLLIEFNKVRQPTVGPASVYSFWAKAVGNDTEIPVGTAQFSTF